MDGDEDEPLEAREGSAPPARERHSPHDAAGDVVHRHVEKRPEARLLVEAAGEEAIDAVEGGGGYGRGWSEKRAMRGSRGREPRRAPTRLAAEDKSDCYKRKRCGRGAAHQGSSR